MIAGPSYAAQPIPLMSENNHKVWTWTPKTRQYHLTISHWSWTTENLELLLFLDQKTLACYRENQLPEREGDNSKTSKSSTYFYFLSFLLTTHYANDCTSANPGRGCNLRPRYTRPVEARCTSWQVQPSALITGICKTDNRFTSRVNSGQMSGKNMKSGAAKNGDVLHKRGFESKLLQKSRKTQVELESKPNWSSWRVGSTIQAVAAVLGANM